MSGAQAPPPTSPIAGATQGMATPPPGGGNLKAMFEQNVQQSIQLIRILSQTPGVDQEKLKQAVGLLNQGMQMLGQAVQPKPGGAPPPAPPPA